MRVLHVIPSVAPRYGGPSTAVGPMCRALMEHGVDSLILTTNADGDSRLAVPCGSRTTWQGVPAIFFERDFSESFKYSSGLAHWLRDHVSEFDVVHVHAVLSHACLAATASCRRAGVPYVLRPLGTLAPWSLSQKGLKKRIVLALGGRRAIQSAGAIHCTSEEERRGIEQAFPGARGVVIPLGVDSVFLDAPEVSWAERNADPYVLAMSRLHPKKNLEALIEAFLAVGSRLSEPWRLVIAGSGEPEYVARLHAFVREQAGSSRVSFPGWVEGEQKRELIRNASVFALASRHENFGISVLEALASGVPAVLSQHVDLSDIVRAARAGWIVDTSVETLCVGLAEALGSRDERSARAGAARKLAKRFAWSDIAGDLVDLYRRLLPGSAPMAGSLLSSAASAGH
jgi:glycosyltransferase involved in cell wall biosynthesis